MTRSGGSTAGRPRSSWCSAGPPPTSSRSAIRSSSGWTSCPPAFRRGCARDSLRHHSLHHRVDGGGGQDPDRGDDPGHPGGLSLSGELARDRDPAPGRSGEYHRDVPGAPGPRLHHQHPDPLRPGARDRYRGRRCDRGDRERRADHGRGAPAPAGGGGQGHPAGERRAGGHRPVALRGVRTGGVHQRDHRGALPRIRAHHRDRHRDFRDRGAHPHPGPLRHPAPGPRGRDQEPFLPGLQPRVRQGPEPVRGRGREGGGSPGPGWRPSW